VNNLPNKAYGDAYGLEWDGRQWVKANPNADLERQAMELELEQLNTFNDPRGIYARLPFEFVLR
jgi:hypothetical protein